MKNEHVSFEVSGTKPTDCWKDAKPIQSMNPTDIANRRKMRERRAAAKILATMKTQRDKI